LKSDIYINIHEEEKLEVTWFKFMNQNDYTSLAIDKGAIVNNFIFLLIEGEEEANNYQQ
jgi:hypothetical protein